MGDGGDGPALFDGCCREQGACRHKENAPQVAGGKFAEKVRAEHARAAAGAGTAAVNILCLSVKNEFTAVFVQAFNVECVFFFEVFVKTLYEKER